MAKQNLSQYTWSNDFIQSQSIFFNPTPLEVRFQIYEYVIRSWGIEKLHVVPRVFDAENHEFLSFEGPFCYIACTRPLESFEDPTIYRQSHTRFCDTWVRSHDSFYAERRKTTSPTFMQTCRRLHVEATAVLYNICVIDFGYFDHAAAFLSSMNPALVEHVRTLHISGYKWPPVSPNSPALNAPPPDSIDAYCATWDKLCDILRGMQNLRDLRISLNNREYSEEREAKLIDEVRRIGVKGTTVIQVPPRIKPEGSGEEDLGPPPAWRYELVIGELWHEGKALFRMDRRGENGYDDRHCDSQTPEFYPRGLLFKPITRKPSFKFPPPATKPSWKSRLVAPFFICARYWRNSRTLRDEETAGNLAQMVQDIQDRL